MQRTLPPRQEREKIGAQASRKADGVVANQVRTKATNRANSKKEWYGPAVVHCKGMVLSLECRFVTCAYRSNKTQHRDRINIKSHIRLIKALGRGTDFQHALDE